MEELFSLKRFGLLLKSDLKNAWKSMNFSFCLMSLSGVISYAINLIFSGIFSQHAAFKADSRLFIYCVTMITLFIITPSRCYGHVTHLKKGRSFLLIPASYLEKTLSMILVCLLIIPLLSSCIYFIMDALICTIHPACGMTVLEFITGNYKTPYFVVTGIISFCLFFLLGAIVFKKGKIFKTIGCLIAYLILAGMIVSAFLTQVDFDDYYVISFFHTLYVLILSALIGWRVRTLQH